MKIGFIGLGKMGSRMVLKLIEEGHKVVAWNRSSDVIEELKFKISPFAKASGDKQNFKIAANIQDLVQQLHTPRIVWGMVPAGKATEEVLKEVLKYVEKDDIVIDGGNAFYKDTEKRYQKLRNEGIRFLGIGVSGGIIAARDGYPIMTGGSKSAYEFISPILDSLAKPKGGHEYFGEGGAGHFVKMVHNGIEYGIMQSLGEGFGVLEKSPYKLDLVKVAKLYQKGTLVSGFMLDRVVEALLKDPQLSQITGYIEESGEAKWTVEQAKEEGVEVEIINRSLEFRRRSQKDSKVQNSFSARMVAALRNAFGGHSVVKKD
ncbi:MAG: decarboxylating 6-phosphogluconate dehydrogenase [bacterium]|nr:decarboxylating 6-phosphogluconate dehydrogenase [bacterium]